MEGNQERLIGSRERRGKCLETFVRHAGYWVPGGNPQSHLAGLAPGPRDTYAHPT